MSSLSGVVVPILLLMTCFSCDSAVIITAKAGEDAVLPCSCPSSESPFIVWQKEQVVVYYIYDQNSSDPEYRSRTQLKLQLKEGRCSLVLKNVRLSDKGLYTCYFNEKPLLMEEINLEVADIECTHSNGMYHCCITGLHSEEKIQWRLNGQPLQSSEYSVQCRKDQITGLYNITDSVSLNTTVNSKLICEVANPNMGSINTTCHGPHHISGSSVPRTILMTSTVCGVFAVVFIIASIYVGITCKKGHRQNNTGRSISRSTITFNSCPS